MRAWNEAIGRGRGGRERGASSTLLSPAAFLHCTQNSGAKAAQVTAMHPSLGQFLFPKPHMTKIPLAFNAFISIGTPCTSHLTA
ncbi:hypothetical protein BHE74_00057362 [Ensete ventricosum]|nr:hypothetical protein BHE74_00057362 [Ensete ventricosum]